VRAANDNHPAPSAIRFRVDPRLLPPAKAARRLHLSPEEFGRRRAELEGYGFPRPLPVTGYYDLVAIDAWIDSCSGLGQPANYADDFDKRLARLG
jgi:hypothetical protein